MNTNIDKPLLDQARKIARDDIPKMGDWFWVALEDDWENDNKVEDQLVCVTHIGSNYVQFTSYMGDDSRTNWRVHFNDLLKSVKRPEPLWRELIQQQVENVQKQIQAAVKELADVCIKHNLIRSESEQENPASLLPVVSSGKDPVRQHKRALIKLKKETAPEIKKRMDELATEMVGLQKSLFLGERAKMETLQKAVEETDERLFALEMYAGLTEDVKQIADGEPAPQETPIAIRQMLRFMDEECLIDAMDGGMDYSRIADFDKWAAIPENRDRITPEQRCIVALKVRRHEKEYDTQGLSLAGLFETIEKHKANMKTYLLMRNGEKLFRLATEIEFSPRLLPLREEFNKPFVDVDRSYNFKTHKDEVTETTITPDDVHYDEHADKRRKEVRHYNRTIFLVQGLLDRSKVFSPHPTISLRNPEHVDTYLKLIRDEEDGLPAYNPPDWEKYRYAKNSKIKVGDWVYAYWETVAYSSNQHHSWTVRHKDIYDVTQIKRDRSSVRVSWPYADRHGWEHPQGWYSGYGEYGDWPVNRKHHRWVPMKDVFNVAAYKVGDYKQFLCDAYLKGEYLKWAPQLLSAEKWWQKNPTGKSTSHAAPRKKGKRPHRSRKL